MTVKFIYRTEIFFGRKKWRGGVILVPKIEQQDAARKAEMPTIADYLQQLALLLVSIACLLTLRARPRPTKAIVGLLLGAVLLLVLHSIKEVALPGPLTFFVSGLELLIASLVEAARAVWKREFGRRLPIALTCALASFAILVLGLSGVAAVGPQF